MAEDLVMSSFSMRRESREYRFLCTAIQQASLIYPYYPAFDVFCRNIAKFAGEASAQAFQLALIQGVAGLWELAENRKLFDELYGYSIIEKPSAKDFVYTMGGYVCRSAGRFQETASSSAPEPGPTQGLGGQCCRAAVKRGMTKEELYGAYLAWLDGSSPCSAEEIFLCPVVNQDIFEDESRVVNRLWYVVSNRSEGRLKSFTFFEENLFSKDAQGDLDLVQSTYYVC